MRITKLNSRYAKVVFTRDDLVKEDLIKYVASNQGFSIANRIYNESEFAKKASEVFLKENPEYNTWFLESIHASENGDVEVIVRISKDMSQELYGAKKQPLKFEKDKLSKILNAKSEGDFMQNVIFLNSKSACVTVSYAGFTGTEAEIAKIAKHIGQYGNVTGYNVVPKGKVAQVLFTFEKDAGEYLTKSAYIGGSGVSEPEKHKIEEAAHIKQLKEFFDDSTPSSETGADTINVLSDEEFTQLLEQYGPTEEDIAMKEAASGLGVGMAVTDAVKDVVVDDTSAPATNDLGNTKPPKSAANDSGLGTLAFEGGLGKMIKDQFVGDAPANTAEPAPAEEDPSLAQQVKPALEDVAMNALAVASITSELVDKIASGECSLAEAKEIFSALMQDLRDNKVLQENKNKRDPENPNDLENIDLSDDDKQTLDDFYKEFAPTENGLDSVVASAMMVVEKRAFAGIPAAKLEKEAQYLIQKYADETSFNDKRVTNISDEEVDRRYEFVKSIPAELKLSFSGRLSEIAMQYADDPAAKDQAIRELVSDLQSKMNVMSGNGAELESTILNVSSAEHGDSVGWIKIVDAGDGTVSVDDYKGNSAFITPLVEAISSNPGISLQELTSVASGLEEAAVLNEISEIPSTNYDLGYADEGNTSDIENVTEEGLDVSKLPDAEVDENGNVKDVASNPDSRSASISK